MPEMAASQGMEVKIKDDWRTIFGRAGRESTMVSAVAEVVLSLFVDDDRAATAAADTCAAMWGVVASWRHRGELRIQSAKEQLRASLATILQRVQQQFLHTELAYGAMSFVDHHFESLVQAMDEQIRDLAERKLAEARAEIARGEEAALMDDAQRRARADEVADQMGQWDVMTRRMAAILDDLRALQHGSEVPSEMAS